MTPTATLLDRIEAARTTGDRDREAEDRHRFLLPIVKTWCAENGFRILATECLQTFGGSGYTREYPLEQYVRDTKIDAIYEGTTGIQALDLMTRRIARDRGAVLDALLVDIQRTTHELRAHATLEEESDLLDEAIATTRRYVRLTLQRATSDPRLAAMGATRLLNVIGDIIVAWLLLRSAEVAQRLAQTESDERVVGEHTKRIAAGRWFARQILPRITADLRSAQLLDPDAMTLSRAHL